MSPFFFADDDLLLDGSRIDQVMMVLGKIGNFTEVSGLSHNRRKYEFLVINCREEDAER